MQKSTNQIDLNTVNQHDTEFPQKKTTNTVEKNRISEVDKSEKGFNWLTEHSRNFLAAGYINSEIKAETRIREIADRAEEILGIKGYSDKFYNYMSEGFFSLASPVWSNFGKKKRIAN